MCMKSGMHLCFLVATGSATSSGQPSYISVLLTHGRPSECSVLLSRTVGSRGKSRFCSHSSYAPSSGNPSKRFLSRQARGVNRPCGLPTLRGACHSGEGGLLTLLDLGLGFGLGRLNPGPWSAESTVGHRHLTASLYHRDSFV